jgi:hypothetical protein
MGADGYRDTEEFYERCARLRRILSDEGALHAGAAADGGAA